MNVLYEIYQTPVSTPYCFRSFSEAMEADFSQYDYNLKYCGEIDITNRAIGYVLDEIFVKHNRGDRPNGKKMRSLSVSDVVVLDGHPYYCDSYGWSEIPPERW